jgi:hypothetical protein
MRNFIKKLLKENIDYSLEEATYPESFNIEEFKRVNGLELESRKTFTCGSIEQGIRMPSAISVPTMRETPIQPSRSRIRGVRMSPLPMANLSAISLNSPVVWID